MQICGGGQHPWGLSNCPAANTRCHKCGKTGHFSKVCRSKTTEAANACAEDQTSDAQEEHGTFVADFAYATTTAQNGDQGFYLTLRVNGKDCRGLLDTGATRTVISEDIVSPSRACDRVLKAYDGGEIHTLGMADVEVSTSDRSASCACFVVPAGHTVLFGQDIIRTQSFGISPGSHCFTGRDHCQPRCTTNCATTPPACF